jgi:Domain of unknown function (DUF4145)
MGLLVADCPRCGSRSMTFDVVAQVWLSQGASWQDCYEIFCNCRQCHLPTTFLVVASGMGAKERFSRGDGLVTYHSGLNEYFTIDRFISIRDIFSTPPPEHLPDAIKDAFIEGAACLSIECFNAAATMFRLCVDLVTRPLLPDPEDKTKPQPNAKQRRDLGLRLPWLFDNGLLPSELGELAGCIKEDGNDGAHVGNLTKADAEDLVDFTTRLLDRLVSEPERLKLAKERRIERRAPLI